MRFLIVKNLKKVDIQKQKNDLINFSYVMDFKWWFAKILKWHYNIMIILKSSIEMHLIMLNYKLKYVYTHTCIYIEKTKER